MAVTPKNGLGKYGPARSYERTVATINSARTGGRVHLWFSASQHQIVPTIFASNVPTREFLEKLVARSADCGEIPQRTWCFATASGFRE